MQFLAYLLIPIMVGIIFAGIKKEVFKFEKDMNTISFVVRQSRIVILVGLLAVVFFGACIVLMTIFPNDTATWWVYLIFFLGVLGGAILSLYGLFWEVRVDGNNIHFSSFLKKTKEFTFIDIKKSSVKIPLNISKFYCIRKHKNFLLWNRIV